MELFEDVAKPLVDDLIRGKNGKGIDIVIDCNLVRSTSAMYVCCSIPINVCNTLLISTLLRCSDDMVWLILCPRTALYIWSNGKW